MAIPKKVEETENICKPDPVNVKLLEDKFGFHQTCTIYCGVVALSIAYLVGFLKKPCEELLWKNAEPDFRNLRNICVFRKVVQEKLRLHQTCTIYCGVVALSSYYGRTLSLIPAGCVSTAA